MVVVVVVQLLVVVLVCSGNITINWVVLDRFGMDWSILYT